MENLTIIYYTSNREDVEFERKIIDNLKKQTKDIPIISVSQKPIDLGKNICIGDIGLSYLNEWKQLLIGLKEAKTEFCIATESDCLYPPDYFTFIPPVNNKVYRYDNVWAFWKKKSKFWKKASHCEGAQICGREYWIECLENMLKNYKGNDNKSARHTFSVIETWTGNPVITFKTGDGVSNKTGFILSSKVSVLPYWGKAIDIKKRMFNL